MKPSRAQFPGLLFAVLCVLSLALFAYPAITTRAKGYSAEDTVTEAWQRARDAGSYRYSADVVQVTIPKPKVTNVGRTSRRHEMRIEGETDLPGRTMHMRLWTQGGSVANAQSGVEVRLESDRAYARQGTGPWEEIDNFTDLFAPQGDFMAFLSAAKDITFQGTETRQLSDTQASLSFSRYTFRIDGLSYARFLRDQIQKEWAERGQLPPGVNLDLPRHYVDMTGEGELWIGRDGLPLRQIIHLNMPERPDARIEADITADFSGFASARGPGQKTAGAVFRIPPLPPISDLVRQGAFTVPLLALVVVLIVFPRSKKLYRALALALIISVVFTPLLRNVQAANFADRQARQAREQEQRREESEKQSEMVRAVRRLRTGQALSGRLYHPNVSPFERPPLPNLTGAQSLPAPLMPPGGDASFRLATTADDGLGLFNCRDDNGADADGDGLTDCQEELLGTNPDGADSDGDTITDTLEVQGFNYGGQTWYTDPLEIDTNKDGINDLQEWNLPGSEHATWDIDGDNTPDLFDLDNDGDGVPDELDISPSTGGQTVFDDDNPLLLKINDLEAGKPTYVEFQLRPTNPDHLWYAMNVLDWPKDNEAQMQDGDDQTFHDVDPNTALSPNANGDLKLIPMLEIRISGDQTNLPPQEELDRYGIFVTDMNRDGSDKAVYVPLSLVTDHDDEGRAKSHVAFYGKMLYRPETSWGNAQQVRVVWLVQALIDRCAEDGYEDGMCKTYDTYNEVQVIHTYYDQWTLAGLGVREDHGVDVAVIYEDPEVDTHLDDDGALFVLAHAFDYTFLAARDADENGQRDITVDELYRRFDHRTNLAISEEERWGITNTLSVEVHAYEHLDEALVTIAMTDTKALLESVFTPYWSESTPITPTLMFAREERARTANADMEGHGSIISWDDSQLTVDLPSSGDGGIPVTTMAGVRWSPYCFRAGWEADPIDAYWEELEQRYPFSETEDPEEAAGMTFFSQVFYLGVYQGVDSVVQLGDVLMETEVGSEDVAMAAKLGFTVAGSLIVKPAILTPIIKKIAGVAQFSDPARFFKLLGMLKGYTTVTDWAKNLKIVKYLKWAFGKEGWRTGVALVAGAIVALALTTVIVAVVVYGLYQTGVLENIIGSFASIVAFFIEVYQIQWVQDVVKVATTVWNFVSPVLKFLGAIFGAITTTTMWAGVAGLILEVAIIWIVFIVQFAVGRLTPGSIPFNMLLAQTIAATVLAILMFLFVVIIAALSTVGIGLLIGAIVALVMGIAEGIGAIFGFSPTEWIIARVAELFYNARPMVESSVDVSPLQTGGTLLADPERGFEAGNKVRVAMRVGTTLDTKPLAWWQYATSPWCWDHYDNQANFDAAAFKYKLARGVPSETDPNELVPQTAFPSVTSGEIDWNTRYVGLTGPIYAYRGETSQNVELPQRIELQGGINSSLPVLFLTSYSVPVIQYAGFLYYGCWTDMLEGEAYSDAGIVYDVFPSSLDRFYDLKATDDGGYRLSWDPAFETLRDADGDGLISPAHDGNDPDDGKWDADGDGLSDAYELELREAGSDISPNVADTDGDDLSDGEEIRLGTDPTQKDSDGDGLNDNAEIQGWAFTFISGKSTWAKSDPLSSDTDGDGMSDLTEKTLHELDPDEYVLHPHVPNPSPIAIYAAIGDEDGVVAAGATVPYTASVQNNLSVPRYSLGDLTVDFPAVLGRSDLVADYTLFMGQAITVTTDLNINAGLPSQRIDITNRMSAQLIGNPLCADIRVLDLHCVTETDNTPGTHDWFPPGSEVSVFAKGSDWSHVWGWDEDGVNNGESFHIDDGAEFCNPATVHIWECDWYEFGCSPRTLETWGIDAQNQGTFSQPIDDYPGDYVGSLDYSIQYVGGTIDLSEVVPVTIDADVPTVAAITSLSDGQYVQGTGEILIVGGIAQDPTSSIAQVEISLDGGAWEAASGAESWAYAWPVPTYAGAHTFRARATDVVGHTFTEPTDTTVIVDAHPPDIDTAIANNAIVTATDSASGRWTVRLYGTAQDLLEPGGDPGSGVRSVQALLEGADEVAGRGWQTATLTAQGGNNWIWNLDYLLPAINNDSEMMSDPSGEYNFVVRATDNAGNLTGSSLNISLRIDSIAPVATITSTGPSSTTITQPLSITGIITDPGIVAAGLAGGESWLPLEIAYTPQEIATAFSPADVDMLLHLDEAAGATAFRDAVGHNNASCIACPASGVAGPSGTAVQFDGADDWIEGTDFDIDDDFSISLWVNPSTTNDGQAFISKHTTDGGNIIVFGLYDGGYRFHLRSDYHQAGAKTTGWQHLVAVGRKTGPSSTELTLFKNGDVLWQETLNDVVDNAAGKGWAIGQDWDGINKTDFFGGMMDEVVIFDHSLSAPEVKQLYDVGMAGRNWLNWQEATLAESGAGITRTTWSHTVPSDLEEGIYRIDLRGSDALGNRNDDTSTWPQWHGEIDLHGPRVQIGYQLAGQTGDETARTEYTCSAVDFNLVQNGFECPCPVLPGDRQYYDADWFRAWISDTARLHRIETACLKPGHQPPSTARVAACDSHGHCSEATTGAVTTTSLLDSVVFTPTHGFVHTSTDPFTVAGGAYADRISGLRALTVTVDSAIVYTQTWAPGASHGEIWETTWPSPTDGVHTLRSIVADHDGYVQAETRPVTMYVDSQAPEIALPTAVLTTAHRLMAGQLILTAPYTETGGVASIQVRESGGEWGDGAVLDEDTWRYAWFLDQEPDGEPYTLTARMSDVAGRTAQQSGTVTVDVVRPQAVTVTLAYTDSQGAYTVITPGHTVRDVLSPTLLIEWTASSDGSGLAGYLAGWTDEATGQDGLSFHSPSDRRHEQSTGEAQVHYAHVIGQDVHGNRYSQTVGPIYTDAPTTSDYILLPSSAGFGGTYRGWMESGCSQIGADRELARYAQAGQALTDTQRFYATWNTDTLRLTWTGANWSSDGDLFIYFDTAPGGTTVAYNPYPSAAAISLPAQDGRQLEADYMVWVQDADTASLMEWDGGGWVNHSTATLNGLPYYQLDTSLHPVHTDLALPFSWLGIDATTPVKMVALASEENALRLWSAMPEKNPLNSAWAINTLAEVEQIASSSYALTQQYEWDTLAPGLCPNAGQFTDADLQVDISADPTGVEVGYLEHDLLFVTPGQPLDADLDGEPEAALPMDTDPRFVGQGMVVNYTVHYANEGTEIAPGVRLTVTARGAVQLSSDPLVLNLGDVAPGITGTLEFQGTVDTSVHTASAEIDAVVADNTHGPFDWIWIQHDVDMVAPESVEIEAPLGYIRAYTNTVRGTVYDPSGVPFITLNSRLLPFGRWFQSDCNDATPDDGQWSCSWNVNEAAYGTVYNGDQFMLQALATDPFGNGPTRSKIVTVTVDTLPPTIDLDLTSEEALRDLVLGAGDQILLSGEVQDDQQASGAELCFGESDEAPCDRVNARPGSAPEGTWRYALRALGELDYADQTIYLYGVDGAGNLSTLPLTRTYKVDNVAPVVTVTTWIRHILSDSSTPVLSGEAYDGGGSDVYVLVESPDGTLTSSLATRDEDEWSYVLDTQTEGSYALRIEARDGQGNVRGYGPFDVFVGRQFIYLPLVLRH